MYKFLSILKFEFYLWVLCVFCFVYLFTEYGGVCSGVNIYKGLLFLFYLKTMIMLEKDIYEFEC